MNCHQARVNAQTYVPTTAGSAYFGPHEGPQADMLEGANGYTYGQSIPSSAHAFVAQNTCVDCHMQTVATTDPAFLQAGGHTFKPSYIPPAAHTGRLGRRMPERAMGRTSRPSIFRCSTTTATERSMAYKPKCSTCSTS